MALKLNMSDKDMLYGSKKTSTSAYCNSLKARRGKPVANSTKSSWLVFEEDLIRYEFFLNNSEIEHSETTFTEKESIVVELVNDRYFSTEDKRKLAKRLKEIVMETFLLNTFVDDEDINETYYLITVELDKTGMEYSIDINRPGKLFPSTTNEIPKNNFYYSLTCSYKMKDSEPFTYISEKAKISSDFYIETNKAYNNGFFDMDENPNIIYLNIWNKVNGKDKMRKETLYPNNRKTGEPNEDFTEVIEILKNSEFEMFETKYSTRKVISF